MQSSKIILQTTGEQDKYLTKNPIHTHFKTNYRQYTQFGSDWIVVDNDSKSQIQSNSTFYFRVQKDGDLINNMFLRLKLQKSSNWENSTFGLYETALKIIDRVEFLNNDKVISSMSSDYMFSYFELQYSKAEKKALFDMISYDKSSVGEESSEYVTLYLPLPLWFHKNPGNAFPLWALNNPNVGLRIKTSDYSADNKIVDNIELLVDFGFLDNKEKEQFTNKPLEYLIEVPEKLDNITLTSQEETMKLNLVKTHFVRYLVWNIQEVGTFNFLDDIKNVNISFNGNPLVSNAPGSFYNKIMRYMNFESNGTIHSTNGIFNKNDYSNIYTYSFCLNPLSKKLSGYFTTEKFNNVEMEITTQSNSSVGSGRTLNIYLVKHNIMRVSDGLLNLLYN